MIGACGKDVGVSGKYFIFIFVFNNLTRCLDILLFPSPDFMHAFEKMDEFFLANSSKYI